jgi:hypothetical protein
VLLLEVLLVLVLELLLLLLSALRKAAPVIRLRFRIQNMMLSGASTSWHESNSGRDDDCLGQNTQTTCSDDLAAATDAHKTSTPWTGIIRENASPPSVRACAIQVLSINITIKF